jgi:NADP-dependent alcohol dehydrogenase
MFLESLGIKMRMADYGVRADAIDGLIGQLEAHGMIAASIAKVPPRR